MRDGGRPKFGTHPEFATLVEENWTQRRQYAMELRTACAKDYGTLLIIGLIAHLRPNLNISETCGIAQGVHCSAL